jgi:methylthioribose-1-phosphate isomerase
MKTIWWQDGHPVLLDQTRLPFEEVVVHCRSTDVMAEAIVTLRVRGAPAIGVAAAYGLAHAAFLAADRHPNDDARFRDMVADAAKQLAATRPTAVNLSWAINRLCARVAASGATPMMVAADLLEEARAIAAEDESACQRMGELGAPLIEPGMHLLTHCNAGALATAGIGTATAPIFIAHALGRPLHVFVNETRPLLQGARLTAWEFDRAGVPFTLIADNMAASLMRRGQVNAVFVGADRIAANGDVANKIGTFGVALAAHAHDIPFYVVAPTSTLDLATADGDAIPIEERNANEVRSAHGHRLVPDRFPVYNPAFDVTPAAYVTAIITEQGIARAPYTEALAGLPLAGRRKGSP